MIMPRLFFGVLFPPAANWAWAARGVAPPALADVVGPSIASDGPYGYSDQIISERAEMFCIGRGVLRQPALQFLHACPLFLDPVLRCLVSGLDGFEKFAHVCIGRVSDEAFDELQCLAVEFVHGQPHPEPELRIILKKGIGPGGPPVVGPCGVS